MGADAAGNAWFLRAIYPPSTGTSRTRLERIDPQGTIVWARDYDTTADDEPADVAIDANGNAFVIGTSQNDPSGSQTHVFVSSYDASGAAVWSQTYTGTAPRIAGRIRIDSAGDLRVAGENGGNPTGLFAQKWTANGALVWTRVFSPTASPYTEFFSDMTLDAADNTYVCGAHGIPDFPWLPTWDGMVTARIDPAGNLAWVRLFNPVPRGRANSLACDSLGRVFVTGQLDGLPGAQLPQFTLIAYDAAGNLLWSDTATDGIGQRVVVDRDDHVLVAFAASIGPIVYAEARLRKYDGLGAMLWETTLGPFGAISDLIVDEDRAITLVRNSPSSTSWMDRVDRDGNLLWTIAMPQMVSLAECSDQSVRVAGGSTSPFQSVLERIDPWIRSYCFGDGSLVACPCGNQTGPGEREGCVNSLGTGGKLFGVGVASLANDTLVLQGTRMPDAGVLYFQGTTQSAAVFGDGLRCASGSVRRLGSKVNVTGASQYPQAGDTPVSVRGQIGAPGRFTYQAWYRNAAAFCTASTFNLTNGLLVDWHP